MGLFYEKCCKIFTFWVFDYLLHLFSRDELELAYYAQRLRSVNHYEETKDWDDSTLSRLSSRHLANYFLLKATLKTIAQSPTLNEKQILKDSINTFKKNPPGDLEDTDIKAAIAQLNKNGVDAFTEEFFALVIRNA